MLKLLTILSNILVTNLQALDALKTEIFVMGLIAQIKATKSGDISLNSVNSLVPECNEKSPKVSRSLLHWVFNCLKSLRSSLLLM